MRASPASTVAEMDAALAPPGTAGPLLVAAEGVAATAVAARTAVATGNAPGYLPALPNSCALPP